jgi:GNAT superfamily N-acetyltransferase
MLDYRRIASADWPAIDALAARTYGKGFGVDYWQRKHDRHPLEDRAPWGVAAFDGSRCVGFFFMLPLPLLVGTWDLCGNQIVDLMTDPDYRGKGIFDKLWDCLLADMVEHGHDFSITFNVLGTAALKGHLKHGYKTLGPLVQYTKVYDLAAFCKDRHGWPLARRAAFGLYAHERLPHPTLLARQPFKPEIRPLWTDTTLAWRKALSPGGGVSRLQHASGGHILVNSAGNDLYVLLQNGIASRELLRQADELARGYGLASLRTSVTAHSPLRWHLRAAGFRAHGPERVVSVLTLNKCCAELMNFERWHLMLGDTDHL